MDVLFKMIASSIFVFIFSSLTFSNVVAQHSISQIQEANCVLPPYPTNGKYTVNNYPTATPGESYPSVKLDVSCDTGYQNENNTNRLFCVSGDWSARMPTCGPCGMISGLLQLDGTSSDHNELPWHAPIYSKLHQPYMQLCGGSLISHTTVISAAHCFWSDVNNLLPASNYAVAVGKLYRPYNDPRDINSQQSDVVEIKIPSRFRGAALNFQNDIALVVLKTPFIYQPSVRPVCLDFNYNFDKSQLTDGNLGKGAGWNIGSKNGMPSPVLKIVDLPYMKFEDCYNISPPSFRVYLTSDKFCAGSNNGTSFSIGDSGAGFAFLEPTTQRYYLRGVLSTSPRTDDGANGIFITFTSILKHENFIKENLK